jgi:CubicO group peptidase (beta-lactamase class C family)
LATLDEELTERTASFLGGQQACGALPAEAGLAVGLVNSDGLLFASTHGLRDRARKLPVTRRTVFELGSLTKAFTATAFLMAAEAELVDLHHAINVPRPVLPLSDPDASRGVSIADILCHRVGLPATDLFWYLAGPSREQLLQAIAHIEPLPGAFRQAFAYNNMLYGAIGHLFESLVGEPWTSYVTRRILRPLQMTSTSFMPDEDEADVALPYVHDAEVPRVDLTAVAAAAAMRSTLDDMGRWIAFHVRQGEGPVDRLLSQPSIAAMQQEQIAAREINPLLLRGLEWLGPDVSYGYGWFIGATRGLKAVYHPAFIDGYSSALVLVPARQIGCIAMMNTNLSAAPGLLIAELLDAALAADETRAVVRSVPADSSMTGTYANPVFGRLSVALDGRKWTLEYEGRQWPLTWKDERTAEFSVDAFGLTIPLSVEFTAVAGASWTVAIPFSLDPRVGPTVFTRSEQTRLEPA